MEQRVRERVRYQGGYHRTMQVAERLARVEERVEGLRDDIRHAACEVERMARLVETLEERLTAHERRWLRFTTVTTALASVFSAVLGALSTTKLGLLLTWLLNQGGSATPPASSG